MVIITWKIGGTSAEVSKKNILEVVFLELIFQ